MRPSHRKLQRQFGTLFAKSLLMYLSTLTCLFLPVSTTYQSSHNNYFHCVIPVILSRESCWETTWAMATSSITTPFHRLVAMPVTIAPTLTRRILARYQHHAPRLPVQVLLSHTALPPRDITNQASPGQYVIYPGDPTRRHTHGHYRTARQRRIQGTTMQVLYYQYSTTIISFNIVSCAIPSLSNYGKILGKVSSTLPHWLLKLYDLGIY